MKKKKKDFTEYQSRGTNRNDIYSWLGRINTLKYKFTLTLYINHN